uniref:Uncharacterized protein n=1 Tax=Arundo donax TaxID=35708 RepID=A0A0A9AMT3_ARUDO
MVALLHHCALLTVEKHGFQLWSSLSGNGMSFCKMFMSIFCRPRSKPRCIMMQST